MQWYAVHIAVQIDDWQLLGLLHVLVPQDANVHALTHVCFEVPLMQLQMQAARIIHSMHYCSGTHYTLLLRYTPCIVAMVQTLVHSRDMSCITVVGHTLQDCCGTLYPGQHTRR